MNNQSLLTHKTIELTSEIEWWIHNEEAAFNAYSNYKNSDLLLPEWCKLNKLNEAKYTYLFKEVEARIKFYKKSLKTKK